MDSQAAMDWCCLSAWPAHAVLVTQAETSHVSGSVHRMEDRLMVKQLNWGCLVSITSGQAKAGNGG